MTNTSNKKCPFPLGTMGAFAWGVCQVLPDCVDKPDDEYWKRSFKPNGIPKGKLAKLIKDRG